VPSGEGDRVVHGDDEIVPESRIERAQLGLAALDQEPRRLSAAAVLKPGVT
jgi:hypothetical protein